MVQPGSAFTQIWCLDDLPEASIDIRIERASPVHRSLGGLVPDGNPVPAHLQAVLRYRVGQTPNDMRQITDVIVLAQTHCGCLKESLRFRCPGCSRRVADLYPDGHYFRCRKCCGVGYQSQRETPKARGLAKAARIKQKLGGTGEYGERVPKRPKGMRRQTYERLLQQVAEAERPWNEGIMRALHAFQTGLGLLTQTEQTDVEQLASRFQQALENPELLRQARRSRGRGKKNQS